MINITEGSMEHTYSTFEITYIKKCQLKHIYFITDDDSDPLGWSTVWVYNPIPHTWEKKAAKFALCTLKGCNCITVLWFERRFRRAVYFWMPGWKVLTCCDSKTNRAENKTNTTEPQIHSVTKSVLSRTFADMHCQSDVLENTQHLRPARSRRSTCFKYSLKATLFLCRFHCNLDWPTNKIKNKMMNHASTFSDIQRLLHCQEQVEGN